MEEGGPPLLIPRLEVDGGVAEEEFHHLLLATLGSLHQRGVALPVLGVGVDTLGQQGLDAGKVALSARPVELGLAQGTIQVRVDYLLLISNLLYSVLDLSYPIPWVNCLRGGNGGHNPAGEVSAGMHPHLAPLSFVVEHLAAVEESSYNRI